MGSSLLGQAKTEIIISLHLHILVLFFLSRTNFALAFGTIKVCICLSCLSLLSSVSSLLSALFACSQLSTECLPFLFFPSLCIVAPGAKRVGSLQPPSGSHCRSVRCSSIIKMQVMALEHLVASGCHSMKPDNVAKQRSLKPVSALLLISCSSSTISESEVRGSWLIVIQTSL